jgi:poly(3-hydroxybutyrate) depolymerase
LTYVPRRLAARTSAPIVIALHGWGSSAESFRDFQTHAGFEPLADRDGFIVVYGNAAPGSATSVRVPNSGAWRQPRTADDEVDDVAYLDTVLDDLRSRQIVDGSNRVFLVGQSNGGGMVIEAARLRPNRYTGFAAMMPFAGLSPASPAVLDVGHLSRILFAYSATDPGLPAGYVSTLRPLADRWAAALGFSPAAIAAPTRTALVDRVHEGDGYEGSLPAALATRRSHGEQLDLRAAGAPASAPALRILAFDHAGHFWPHPTQDTLPFILEKWGLRNQDLDAADAVWSFFKDAAPGR